MFNLLYYNYNKITTHLETTQKIQQKSHRQRRYRECMQHSRAVLPRLIYLFIFKAQAKILVSAWVKSGEVVVFAPKFYIL
jgi:hypothetical protein